MEGKFLVEAKSVQSCAIELLCCKIDGILRPRVNVRCFYMVLIRRPTNEVAEQV